MKFEEIKSPIPNARAYRKGKLRIIIEEHDNITHLSISHPDRIPSWGELKQTKYHFNVRTNALQGIISHASMIDTGLKVKIIPRLEVLLSDPEDRISRKSASVLSNLKSFSSKPLIETMINTLSDGLQNQMRTVMENFGKDDQPTKELTQLRKEIFNVSKTNKELKEKLLKLETIVFSDKKGSDNQK